MLGGIMEHPARPFVAIVGGAKLADKLEVLKVLATKVDTLVVGGGMAFTFLAAQGHQVGYSLFDPDHLEDCRALLRLGRAHRAADRHPGAGARRDVRAALGGARPAGERQGD